MANKRHTAHIRPPRPTPDDKTNSYNTTPAALKDGADVTGKHPIPDNKIRITIDQT